MSTSTNTERIIQVLDIINNEQRPLTVQSYILFIVNSLGVASVDEILEFTQVEFDIILTKSEISEEADILKNEGQLVLVGEKYNLTDLAKEEFAKRIELSGQKDKKIKENFYKNINYLSEEDLGEDDKNILFDAFRGYIHENFFFYGKAATGLLNASTGKPLTSSAQQLYKNYTSNLPKKLQSIFESYIDELSSFSTSVELDYFEELADRAEQFFALGLSKEMAQELATMQPIDWTILVDTNFLYSVLRIHANNENPAVDSLLKIIDENKELFSIRISYLKETYKELIGQKSLLDSVVAKQILTPNQIKAAFRTNTIDGYTKSYYENQLVHGVATQHPTTILDKAITILKSKQIEIFNGKIKGVDTQSEMFMDSVSEYNKFQRFVNDARIGKGLEMKHKGLPQIDHDIYLRESILALRDKKEAADEVHFQDCKVFGLTLDNTLVNFDKYVSYRTQSKEQFVPCFFTPSYFLKKLYKLLPVQSDNYRKAFLSSIASPVFSSSDNQKSAISQNALAVFHALGIDDLQFIIKNLTNKIFLAEIKNNEETPEKIALFVENELSKELKAADKQKKSLTKALEEKQTSIDEINNAFVSTVKEKSELADKKVMLEQELTTLAQGLKATRREQEKFQSIISSLSTGNQIELPFGNEHDRLEIERLRAEIKSRDDATAKDEKRKKENGKNEFLRLSVIKWQRKSVYSLLYSIAALILVFALVMGIHHWKFTELVKHIQKIQTDSTLAFLLTSIVAISVAIFNLFLLQVIFQRYHINQNIKAYRDTLDIPEEFI